MTPEVGPNKFLYGILYVPIQPLAAIRNKNHKKTIFSEEANRLLQNARNLFSSWGSAPVPAAGAYISPKAPTYGGEGAGSSLPKDPTPGLGLTGNRRLDPSQQDWLDPPLEQLCRAGPRPVWARGHCRISPPRFLAECRKRQLNQVSLLLLYFRLSAFSDLCYMQLRRKGTNS